MKELDKEALQKVAAMTGNPFLADSIRAEFPEAFSEEPKVSEQTFKIKYDLNFKTQKYTEKDILDALIAFTTNPLYSNLSVVELPQPEPNSGVEREGVNEVDVNEMLFEFIKPLLSFVNDKGIWEIVKNYTDTKQFNIRMDKLLPDSPTGRGEFSREDMKAFADWRLATMNEMTYDEDIDEDIEKWQTERRTQNEN